ncbi:trypsin-like [Choristoneura fumiferana]|uniref:trypsin-like n=1 Tax=Choristoneura fumiferana TaxID=7141 RepID=UPI003D15ECE1
MAVLLLAFSLIISFFSQTTLGLANHTCEDLTIIGGHTVSIEDVPYIAALFENDTFSCGGSIIHERFVLTAAHCITANISLKVLVGSDMLSTDGVFIDVEQELCHEEYDPFEMINDICLLKLSEPVPFDCKVVKIALADDNLEIEDGDMVNVTGWGNIKIYGVQYPNDLRQVSVPVVSDECCRYIYPEFSDGMICAGSRGHDSCQGDSGGPLTYGKVQVGVVSYGNGCAVVAGVYTKVSNYLPWINATIESNL